MTNVKHYINIINYYKSHHVERNKVYEMTATRIKLASSYGATVLIGSKYIVHIADHILIQQNEDLIRHDYNRRKEEKILQGILNNQSIETTPNCL